MATHNTLAVVARAAEATVAAARELVGGAPEPRAAVLEPRAAVFEGRPLELQPVAECSVCFPLWFRLQRRK